MNDGDNDEKAESCQTVCPCEHEPQSDHSPGIVKSEEILCRLVWTPEHVTPSGELRPSAFPTSELRGEAGKAISINRQDYVNEADMAKYGEVRAERNKDWGYAGTTNARTGDIRALLDDENNQAFCVRDSAQPENIAHADFSRSGTQDRPTIKRLRGELIDLFGPVIEA